MSTTTTQSKPQTSTYSGQTALPGYKRTEMGVIPEDWEVSKLGSLVNYTNGKAHENYIKDPGRYVLVNSKFISSEGEVKKHSDECFSPTSIGDVLMVMSDVPNGRALARCFFVDENDYYTVNQRICCLSPTHIDGKFLFYKLNRNPFYLAFDDGVKQTNLRKAEVLSCPLGIPKDIAEQCAIAQALSDVDGLIGTLDKLIVKKRAIKQATMQQLLTGKTRLPGFRGKWENKPLGDVLKVRHGRSQHGVAVIDGQYPILASGGEIGRTNTCLYDKPSVLIGRKGTIDNPQFCSSPFWTVDTLFFTEITDGIFAKFIFYKFCMINWWNYNEASGRPSLNARTIESIEISMPQEENEQEAIATVLSDMDAEIIVLERQRDKTQAIKQGVMQQLLTGRIRLVDREAKI